MLLEGGRKIKFGERERTAARMLNIKSPPVFSLDLDRTSLISFSLLSCVTQVHKDGALYILCHRRHGENCGAKCFHSWPPAGARRGGAWPHRRIQHQSLTTCANHGSEKDSVSSMCLILIKIYILTASVWSPDFKFIKSININHRSVLYLFVCMLKFNNLC